MRLLLVRALQEMVIKGIGHMKIHSVHSQFKTNSTHLGGSRG